MDKKRAIILPYKELFTSHRASAVSISVKNSIQNSENKKTTRVFGQYVQNSFDDINFTKRSAAFMLTPLFLYVNFLDIN